MQFTTFSSLLFVLLAVWRVAALPVAREVFDPQITSPEKGDVYTAGQTITVTWKTDELPKGTPNKGEIVLGHITSDGSENLDIDHPLATGFLLTDGQHDITFPEDLETLDTYVLDLFGDSGNISPEFTIKSVGS